MKINTTHIDVHWHHAEPDYPIRLVSEIDADGYETRKLEFFLDGRVASASSREDDFSDTRLGEVPVPSLLEINSDPQFEGIAISAAVFEALWAEHVPR
ncbi:MULTISPECIES: hypothetical protein [unclassified Lysobacter]|uniref:DUF6881 domain-containing protein n=1 Tax=unclassified Lysobacter TaxID=2635362 RepID=UPI0006FA568A|nr:MULTISPECIES: hypothetical protein [unclassified Lysobacter]KRA21226.1 hypothetical protein ASD69_08135 [Lysobacter sp. Root604]SFK28226.1 hypothetical protein SAMN04487938_0142 [Lysobacter sp. cf310]